MRRSPQRHSSTPCSAHKFTLHTSQFTVNRCARRNSVTVRVTLRRRSPCFTFLLHLPDNSNPPPEYKATDSSTNLSNKFGSEEYSHERKVPVCRSLRVAAGRLRLRSQFAAGRRLHLRLQNRPVSGVGALSQRRET